MKKFICLVLVLACMAFTLASCGEEDSTDAAFFEVVSASAPTKISTRITCTVEDYYGSEATFHGMYDTIIDGDNIEFAYSYEKPVDVSDMADSAKPQVKGTIFYIDGVYYEQVGDEAPLEVVASPSVEISLVELNISAETLGQYSITADLQTVTTVLTAEQAEALLGVSFADAVGDVNVTIKTNGTYLTRVKVVYATADASIVVETSYSYNVQTVTLDVE